MTETETNTKTATETKAATETTAKTDETTDSKDGASYDVTALRIQLAKALGVPTASRATLAKLVGAHVNTVALWESGKTVGASYLAKLRELDARIAKGEKISVPVTAKKAGRSKKAVASKMIAAPKRAKAAKKPDRPKTAPSAERKSVRSFNVRALRTKLGASREALAKLLGVSAQSVLNWESGKSITAKNVARLRELTGRVASGKVTLPERRPRGRPRKAVGSPRRAGRPRSAPVATTNEVAPVYANVVSVVKGKPDALVRFALAVPGERRARAVVEVVVPAAVLASLG